MDTENNREALILVEKLCIKFGQIANKLTEVRAKRKVLQETVEETREKEIKEKIKIEEDLEGVLKEIEDKENQLDIQSNFSLRENPFTQDVDSNWMTQSERKEKFKILRTQLHQLKNENDQRLYLAEEDEKEIERLKRGEDMLKEAKNDLEKENFLLQEKVKEKTERIENEIFVNNIEIDAVKSTKHDFRKMLSKTVSFKKRISKIEKELTKEFERLESKKSRMKTLRKLNRTLRKKQGHRLELEDRYTSLSEQSLNLQLLISESMKNLAKKFDVENSELSSVSSTNNFFDSENENEDHFEDDKKAVFENQIQYIKELKGVIKSRKEELDQVVDDTKLLRENMES